ncbi:hypothetical protein PENSPDRAFT_547007, partial [Peniophora sp. CONT]
QSDQLCFNVSNTVTSYWPNRNIQEHKIDDHMCYASLHWLDHVCAASRDEIVRLLTVLETFFVGPKFLFWLEALSAIGFSRNVGAILKEIEMILSHPWSPQYDKLESFIRSAIQFVDDCAPVLHASPPHIYLSALAFCPPSSAVYLHCASYFPNLARPLRHSTYLSHSSQPSQLPLTATFSSDGSYVVVGFDNGEVRAWDMASDRLILKDPSPVSAMAFSADGCYLVWGCENGSLHLRNVSTGSFVHGPLNLQGLAPSAVSAVAMVRFSPDGGRFMACTRKDVLSIWCSTT